MQKQFPPVSEAASAGSASPDTPAAQQQATDTPPESVAPTHIFTWPPPEEDLADWHVFQFGDPSSPPAATHSSGTANTPVRSGGAASDAAAAAAVAGSSATAPTAKLKPSETPTLKIVSPYAGSDSADATDSADTGDLADTTDLSNSDATNPFGPGADAAPVVKELSAKILAAFPAAPASSWPPASSAPGAPKRVRAETPGTVAPVTPDANPTAAGFVTPITAPMPVPALTRTPLTPSAQPPLTQGSILQTTGNTTVTRTAPQPPLMAGPVTPARPSTTMSSLALSGALSEPGAALPARRAAGSVPVPAAVPDAPLMSATVEVIARSAQTNRAARSSWAWLPRTLVIVLALLATGEAAYIGTLVLRAPAILPPGAVLFVQSQPAGADILIDGKPHGRTPLRAELPPGQHVLELRKDGMVRRFPLVLAAGTQASQYVEMRASDTPPASSGPTPRSPSGGDSTSTPGAPAPGPAPGSGAASGASSGAGSTPASTSGGAATTSASPTSPTSGATRGVALPAAVAAGKASPAGAAASPESPGAGANAGAAPGAAGKPVRPAGTTGWLVVQSSVTLSILRNGEAIGNSDDGRLAIAPGHHELELSNSSAGYREAMTIQIAPGQVTTLRPDLPQSTIDIEATPNAKVLIDGREVGETPLTQLALTIGSHDIVLRHPDFADRHVSAFIKVGTPAHVSVDFATP